MMVTVFDNDRVPLEQDFDQLNSDNITVGGNDELRSRGTSTVHGESILTFS